MTRRLLPLLLLVIALPLCGRAAPGPSADLSGLSITTDYANQETIFTGDARLSDGETLLEADEIRYRLDTGIAIATGNVRFTRGAQRILADQITYRRSDQSFTMSQVKLGRYPFYVAGASASGTPDRITVQDATVSVREPGPYQPTVVAESLTYTDNREISAEQAHLGIGRLQPLSLPKFSHRLNLPFISYVSLSAGYRSSLGLFGEAGAHVPLGPETKVGGTVGVYTQRGLMFGPSAHYELERDGREISGDLKSGFINDHGEKLTDVLGRPVPEERGYVQWWHAQDLTERLRLTAQLHYWKDSEILRDFRPREFFRVQEPDNFVEAVYTGSNLHASVFTRLQPNPYHRVQERLPEVRLDLLPTALGHGIYQRLSASAVRLREDPPAGSPTLLSDRLDTYYGLTRSFTPREWLGITPVVGGRVTHYTKAANGGNYTRTLGEVGFDAELRSSAVFDYKNEAWKIDGVRHLLTPRIGYRYIGDADRGSGRIPAIDRETFSTYLPPLGLADTRSIDDLAATNTLRVGLDNTFQTRDPAYGSRDLLVFNAAADLRFDRAPGERSLSAIHTFLAFTPASWLEFNLYQNFTPHDFTLQELNTGFAIRDGDAWALRFSSHLLRSQIEEFVTSYQVRLNEVYEVIAKLHYDARERRFNEQAVGVRQNLHNTWVMEYLVTLYDGPRRESDFGFSVQVQALGF